MIDSATGVILAGGKSTRMGTNKALLPYKGKHLIDAAIEKMISLFTNVVLSVQEENYPDYSLPKIFDPYGGIGPMGGITSVLKSGESRIFCVACDMPFLNEEVIQYLCSFTDDAVIPVWDGQKEVMHAIYSDRLIPDFEAAITAGRYKITDALQSSRVRYIDADDIRRFDPSGNTFKNVNTRADYEKL